MAAAAVRSDVVWSVAVLSFFVALLSAMAIVNSPVLYVVIMEQFGASHKAASWIGSASSIVIHLCGIAVTLLELRFSLYHITLMGATLLWVGLLASAFVPSIAWMTVTIGIIHGGGAGIIFLAMSVYIAAYFDRYRAIASGIKFGGWATAGLIFPRAFDAILRTYGFAGVWILSAAVCMHATPLIMLFKNPPIITFRREEKQSPLSCHLRGTTMSPSKYCSSDEKIPQKSGLPQANQTTATKSKDVDFKGEKDAKIDAQNMIKLTDGKHHTPYNGSAAISKPPQDSSSFVVSERRRNFLNVCEPLRKKIFYAFAPAFICCDYCELASQLTIVDYAMDKGWDRQDATSLIMCLSLGSLAGRLLLPHIADFGFISRSSLMAFCYMAFAAAYLVMPHVSSFHGVILVCVVSEASVGCAMSLKPVLMADYMGIDQIAPTMGVTGIIQLPLIIGNPSIVGFFRDQLGSYDNYYRFVAALSLFVSLTLVAIVVYETRKKRAKVAFA